MNPAQLLAQFDRISDAPDSIPRLRLFILDLAVRGKLVEQDRKDEPASELIKRIEAEKVRLMKVNETTKVKLIPPLAEDALPFLIPTNWCWSQLAKVGFINPRNTAPDELSASFVPMTLISAEYGVVNKHEVRPWAEIKSGYTHFAEGDVGLAKITPCFENRKSTVFRRLTGGIGAGTTELHVIRPILAHADFLLIFLKSPYFIETGIPKMTGTAGQKRVPTEYFAYSPLPLPPLAEQHRIVAKVDELMALCDRLEWVQAERESRRDRLVTSSLSRLNDGAEPDTFRGHARFYFNHLQRLTTKSEHIQQLRQTILNLSVLGKLTADWRDKHGELGDASNLLAQLEQCHEKAGGHRHGNAAAATEEAHDLNVDELPQNWRITDLRTAVCPDRPITYGILMPGPDTPDGIQYVRVADFPKDRLNLATIRRTAKEIENNYARARLRTGDILLSIRGTVGRVCVVPPELQDGNITQDTARLSIQDILHRDFVMWFLRSSITQQRMQNCSKGVAVRGINIGDVRALQLPVPPLAEQQHIVAKVEELMALCDRLEAQLATTQTESRRLLEAVLHEALAPAGS
jgi:type I restriction enzyme S subunit